jgi:hypothetical protein
VDKPSKRVVLIGKADPPTLIAKVRIFAMVFRWIGQAEIAAEEARGQSGRKRAVGNFLLESLVTH